jgi:uncharacterized protein (DUF2249 family)
MNISSEKIRNNTGTITGKLRDLEPGLQYALDVDLVDAASVRTLITNLHGSTNKKFKTEKTATGIKAWRLS